MQSVSSMKPIRWRVLILCAFLLVAILSSFAYFESVAWHDCSHSHCPVCEHAAMLSLLFHSFWALTGLFAIYYRSAYDSSRLFYASAMSYFARTLVACKVRLNN